jgi:anti-sigma factor RsiW
MSKISRHIAFARLVDLVEGRLAPDQVEQAQLHVSACPRCAADVIWLERVIGLMHADDSEDPPPFVIAQARRLFRSRVAPDPPARRRILALPRFDSKRLPLALGMRSTGPADRQMLFSAADYDLDLRVRPAGSLWVIAGQVLGTEQGGQVELRGPIGTTQALLNELSEFVLPPVQAGGYELTVRLSELEIEISGLEIGA